MMGMLLAIGMLVDNAVVDHRKHLPAPAADRRIGQFRSDARAACARSASRLLAGTLSTIIVFLPMVFGEKNQTSIFLVHVAIPIVVAMVASLARRADADSDADRARMTRRRRCRAGVLVRTAAGPLRARARAGRSRTGKTVAGDPF